MRIRKRKVPLPLSLLSPIPLSDPHLFRSPVLVSHGGAAPPPPPPPSTTNNTSIGTSINSVHSQPSDQLTFTFPDTSASDLRRLIVVGNTRDKGVGEGDGMIQTSIDDASNATITTSTMAGAPSSVDDDNNNNHNGSSLLSLSNDNSGLWCDGDKAIPLKKRRGSFNNIGVDDYIPKYNNATPAAATTTPMITKADDNNNDNGNGNVNQAASVLASAKKGNNKRGNTIMEGSRCSRVNGRGWRCCQPTLVGYSLCEHHLGKGRLRSMTSSGGSSSNSAKGSRSTAKNNKSNANIISSPLGRDERQRVADDDDDDDKKTVGNKNKRVKLGLVKARSLSSLLGQTNTIAGDYLTTMEHQGHNQ